jgi:hypothetical protein
MRAWARLVAGLAAASAALVVSSTGAVRAQGGSKVERLFDGRSLKGWYTFVQDQGKNKDPNGVFKVENGLIHVSGQTFGYISTEKEYENYRLSVDFRWGTKKWPPRENAVRDAGLLYHAQGPDMVWGKCLEMQIQEGDTGDMWLIPGEGPTPSVQVLGQRYGGSPKDYTRVVKWADHEKPSGEWNTVTLVARGDRFEHWVNGKCNLRGQNASLTRGRINLQSEGAELWYRNIVLERLD